MEAEQKSLKDHLHLCNREPVEAEEEVHQKMLLLCCLVR
jgi:hypothetical protein